MVCPKCNAKIGVSKQKLTTETGHVTGVLCFICGYWRQEHPKGVPLRKCRK
jgi:Zn ribbon nucleic-acid-binding protein